MKQTIPSPKAVERLRKLCALESDPYKGHDAHNGIAEWLHRYGKRRGDIPKLLGLDPILVQVRHVLREYLDLKAEEYTALALWILHTHVFDQFTITPRLALLSPIHGCGKTTVLDIVAALAPDSVLTASTTAASLFRLIDASAPTVLIDEADNQKLNANPDLRAVLNSGHRKGAVVTRVLQNETVLFSVFAPLAIAAIGSIPKTLRSRSIVLDMQLSRRELKKFDVGEADDMAELKSLREKISSWAAKVELNRKPPLPQFLNRVADNWRVLVSIADMFGPEWSKLARKAAEKLSQGYRDDHVLVLLLNDIRRVFDSRGVDRITGARLVADLCALDESSWSEWRGPDDNEQPRTLTPALLARALASRFNIKTRTVWQEGRKGSGKGYTREQFITAWERYCAKSDTTAQPANVIRLHPPLWEGAEEFG